MAGVILSVGGFAYLLFDQASMIPASLMLTGAGMAIWARRKDPDVWKLIRKDSGLDIGDILILMGVVIALLASEFLELPTRHDRGIALLGPGALFAAGILYKAHRYFRKFID